MYTFDFSGLYVTVMYESIKTFNSLLVSLVSCIHFILKLVSLIEIAIKGIGRERERERKRVNVMMMNPYNDTNNIISRHCRFSLFSTGVPGSLPHSFVC